MQLLQGIRTVHYSHGAVFKIPTAHRVDVFMRHVNIDSLWQCWMKKKPTARALPGLGQREQKNRYR
ncbi:hypothetical protein NHH82_18660 [Oxalobacteraceae bacterium OTU3REALA1]|nr:hypothetical protein NHH82_18660 [Oxalobacteraceae bacterium OTU3REALA1]